MNKTVKQVMDGISTESKMASAKDMQDLCLAILTDKKHVSKIGKFVKGEVIVKEERVLAEDFKELVVDAMVKAGLSKEEATTAADNYVPKKAVADMLLNAHQELLDLYASKKYKKTPLLIKEDIHLSLDIAKDATETTTFSVANPDKGIERKALGKTKKRKARIVNKTLDAMRFKL